MGKFTTIATYSRFESMWNNNAIDNYSLYFIQDTGQLYAHGVLLSSVVFGTEASGAVPVTIAGVTKSLALASHTHSNYIQNNQNIDLQTYKLVSGSNDLIYLSNGNIYVGNTSVPITIQSSTDLKLYRDTHEYTILDTGNFSIGNTTSTNYTLNNVAVFKYGSNTFQLDYVKRINASSTFDSLNSYTLAGTTQVNNKQYGIITLYTDGTTTNPSWAQLRINIPDRTVEYRTSSQTNNWIALSSQNIVQNALDQAGIVAAPSSQTVNMVWKTDAQGNPAWREDTAGTDTWRNIRINDETSDRLSSDITSGALYIKGGTGISVSWDNNKLLITNSSPNVWQAASDTQVGYVPSATKGKFLHCNATTGALEWIDDNNTWNAVSTTQAGYVPQIVTTGTLASSDSPFILVYKNLTGVTVPVWVPLPANAFNNTWQQNTATQAGYVTAPGANVSGKVWMTGSDGTPSWQDANNHTHSYLPLSGGTLTNSNFGEQLTIKRSYADGDSVIKYDSNGTTVGYIGIRADTTPVFYAGTNTSGSGNLIYHSGNLPAYPTKASWNYDDCYVSSVSIYENNLRITKNGGNTDLTIPFASNSTDAMKLKYYSQITTKADLDAFNESSRFKVTTWNGSNAEESLGTSYPGAGNGIILNGCWTYTSFGFQLAIDDDPTWFMALRQRNGNGWAAWKRIPMGDGTGASGTWAISISGDASTLGGTSKDGLFTDFSRSSNTNNLSITIGGTTKAITLGSNAFNSTSFITKNDILEIISEPTEAVNLNDEVSSSKFIAVGWSYSKYSNVSNSPWGTSSSAAGVINIPTQYPFQICRFYNNNDIYIRGYYSGTGWTAWKRIALTGEAPASHSHPYTDLTGSSTTANQAILSNGTANGWKLATLGDRAFDSTAYLPLSGGRMTGPFTVVGTSAGNAAILRELDAITIGPSSSRNTAGYYPGIAFNHMVNYNNAPGNSYEQAPQGWIGLKIHSTPGSELSYLVFATKPGTGTSNSGNDRPIERMNIAPDGTVNILNSIIASSTLSVSGDQTFYGLTQVCNKANQVNYMYSALQIREYNFGGAQDDSWAIAPRLSWHWGGRVQTQIGLASNGELHLSKDQFSNAYKLVYETGTWGISISGDADTVDGKHYSDIILSNGKNLIRSYNVEVTSSSYQVWPVHVMTETVVDGDLVTITIEYSIASGATRTWLGVWTGGGYNNVGGTKAVTAGTSHGTVSITGQITYTSGHNDNGVCIYFGDSNKSGTCTIHRVKVERGDHFTGWSPAPEDLITAMNISSQTVANATNCLPLVGGTMTGSIGFSNTVNRSKRLIYETTRNCGIKYDYAGNEALIISSGNYAPSAVKIYVSNGIALNDSDGQYTTGTPALDLKQNCAAINYNWAATTPGYNLYVNGTSYFTDILQIVKTTKVSIGGNDLKIQTTADTNIAILGSGSSTPASNAEYGILQLFHQGSDKIRLYANPNQNNWIDNGGSFGIGTTSPSYKLHVAGTSGLIGDTTIGSRSWYYQRSGRGAVHHEFTGYDDDYGVVKIRHLHSDGSGGPGTYTATLTVQDERINNLSGTYEPTFYINRTGATTTPPLMGVNTASLGRVFTINSSGETVMSKTCTASGFIKSSSSDDYLLSGGGGHKHVTQLVNSGTASSFASLDITKTFIYINGNIGSYSDANRTISVSAAMAVGQVLTVVAYNTGSSTTLTTSYSSLDGTTISCPQNKFVEISILCYATSSYLISCKGQ